MASLQQDQHDLGYFHFYGASIGNSDTLITAAHCVTGLNANDFIARVGSSYSILGGITLRIKRFTSIQNTTPIAIMKSATM
jgi:hypothetical protein